MFKENFIRLCNNKKVSPSAACRAVGIAPATFSCWTENTVPRKATLIRIADYFGVSEEELLSSDSSSKVTSTDIVGRIKCLLNKKGIYAKDMLADLGINKNQLTRWEKSGTLPNTMVLNAIASYLDTTPEYLTGQTDDPSPASTATAADTEESADVKEFARLAASLPEEDQEKLLEYVLFLKSRHTHEP